jgi:FlaA1/EpsC-like NDP-sugar epimerase
LRLGRDIHIEFTGIRPGEKLYEELSADNEQTCPTSHEKIRVWQLPRASGPQIRRMLEIINSVTQGTREEILKALARCVPEFKQTAAAESPEQPIDVTYRLSQPDERAAQAA